MASTQEKLKRLFEAYGTIAIATYFVLYGLVIGGIAAAIYFFGWKPESAAGTAGVLGAAWVVSRLTMIPRVVATVVLTPVVAKLMGRGPVKPPDANV